MFVKVTVADATPVARSTTDVVTSEPDKVLPGVISKISGANTSRSTSDIPNKPVVMPPHCGPQLYCLPNRSVQPIFVGSLTGNGVNGTTLAMPSLMPASHNGSDTRATS